MKEKSKRIMVTVSLDAYEFLAHRYVRMSPIANRALKQAVAEWKAEMIAIEEEIPSNVRKQEKGEKPWEKTT